MAFRWDNLFSRLRRTEYITAPRNYLPGASGIFVNEDVAMSVSAFHRGVTYIATQVAKLPWQVKDRDNVILEDNITRLLDLAPNPEMNAFTFRVWMVMQALQLGNAYAEIQRDVAGRPYALWPLPTRDVDLLRTADGELVYRVQGASPYVNGGDALLPAKDVFHLRNFHTKNGLLGEGLVAFAGETIGISKAADRMASGIFNNGGMPAGVLKHPGKLSPEAYARLKESWKDQHGGRKSGSVAILEEGLGFEALNLEPEVLQFLESRKFGVVEICRFLGLPPTKLFDQQSATFSNVENANLEVATDTLDAWAVNLEMEADVKMLNNRFGGRYTELDLYAVFRGDMKTRAEYFAKMMQTSSITPNEIRKKEGMPGYKGGDRHFLATNNYTPIDRVDEVLDAQIAPKVAPPANPPKKEEDPAEKELTAAAISYLTKK